MKFGDTVIDFSIGSMVALDRVQGNAAARLGEAIVNNTPVGDPNLWNISEAKKRQIIAGGYRGGALKGNWQLTNGAPASDETGRIDPSGGDTVREMKASGMNAKAGTTTYLSNLRPYAGLIEYGKAGVPWSVQQAPGAMVRANVTKWSVFVRQAAKYVRRKGVGK